MALLLTRVAAIGWPHPRLGFGSPFRILYKDRLPLQQPGADAHIRAANLRITLAVRPAIGRL